MAKSFLTPVNLNKNELQNARVQNLAAAPSSPVAGQIYYDTVLNALYWYNGNSTSWVAAQSGSSVTYGAVTAETSYGISSANGVASSVSRSDHTHGTPTHVAADHSAIKLNDLASATADYSLGSSFITTSGTPSSANQLVTKSYVDSVAAGLNDFKNSVRVATTATGTLATAYENGDTIDGVTLATGDRILIKNQSSASENGIYTVNASGAPTRSTDSDASGELSVGTLVYVESGTVGGAQQWVVSATGASPWVPGSSTSTWAMFFAVTSTQAGAGLTASGNVLAVGAANGITVNADSIQVDPAVVVRKYTTTLTGGATSEVVTHSLNTSHVTVSVWNSGGSFDEVELDVEHTSVNTITVRSAANLPAYNVTVQG